MKGFDIDKDEETHEGIITFYNMKGGYGWVHSETLEGKALLDISNIERDGSNIEEGKEISIKTHGTQKGPVVETVVSLEGDNEEEENSSYSFLENTEEGGFTRIDHTEQRKVTKWSLGNHSLNTEETKETLGELIDSVGEINDDLRETLEQAQSQVSNQGVRDFECVECGLNHGHSDHKHDIRNEFNVTPEFAEQMDFNPFCHCGVNELAMVVDFYTHIPVDIFSDSSEFQSVKQINEQVLETARENYENNPRQNSKGAAMEAGLLPGSAEKLDSELERYFERVRSIKAAANNAPVPESVRTEVSERREEMVEFTS